ncbi:MAG: FKBP-type peptidyl-prolyl cis-trans isomerase [Bacteroidales bacterium]|nr:FKBP-type peptidyl-prolyl cis-trans isomerase [Bacteroidales bacterium]MBP7037994.1 FKBP-type peptidyl-prolyl cis-trans isomerase [Bacteroidales bacterium]
MLGSCAKQSITNAKLKNKVDSLSYAFGIMNYYGLQADSLQLNPVVVAKAMMEAEKEKAKMTEDIARGVIISFVTERQAEMAERQAEQDKVLYKDYIAENEAFLEKNKEKEGVTVTPSGLQYEVIKMGSGNKPTINSTVKVHYVGTLIDGTEFDSSVARGEPAQFPLSGVISGWTEALQLMPVGSKFRIYLPQELAYGGNQAGDKIKPFSTLIFDVELLEIVE